MHKRENDTYHLLSYQVAKNRVSSHSHTPLHFPTISINPDETSEDAVFRAIYLRTGIPKDELVIVREIGVIYFYRMHIDTSIERHDYVLELNTRYPKRWSYKFQHNNDYTEELSICMISHHRLPEVSVYYRSTIEKHIPEFSNVVI